MIPKTQQRLIRGTMISKGVTNAAICDYAKEKGKPITDNYVTYVVTGRRKGYRVRQLIAEKCGVPYSYLWPDEDDPHIRSAA